MCAELSLPIRTPDCLTHACLPLPACPCPPAHMHPRYPAHA